MKHIVAGAAILLFLAGCGGKASQQPGGSPGNPPAATTTYSAEQFQRDVNKAGWEDIPPSNNGGYATVLQFCNEARGEGSEEPLKRFRAQLESRAHHSQAQLDAYIAATKKTCGL